jgi:hypothetical protein
MEDLKKQMDLLRLAELDRVFEFMTQNGWEDLFDAKEDDWIIKRMKQNGCLTRDGVKNKFNALAARAMISKRL